jgi:hypothetical protein
MLHYAVGTGEVLTHGKDLRLLLGSNDGSHYSDAQLDDYHLDGMLRWRPPVSLSVRARFSHPRAMLRGTAGFGFWNDPFGMTRNANRRWPRLRLPQAVWFFFASPPSDMPLATGAPGCGWKTATMDAGTPLAKLLLPVAPIGAMMCRLAWLYRRLWPLAQHVLKIDEKIVPDRMDEWHEYTLHWEKERVIFIVDGVELFRTRYAPRGPLGLVVWLDNQTMVATPQGKVQSGLLATDDQWLEIAQLEVG